MLNAGTKTDVCSEIVQHGLVLLGVPDDSARLWVSCMILLHGQAEHEATDRRTSLTALIACKRLLNYQPNVVSAADWQASTRITKEVPVMLLAGACVKSDPDAEGAAGRHRVLIFAQFKGLLDLVQMDIMQKYQISHLRLDGRYMPHPLGSYHLDNAYQDRPDHALTCQSTLSNTLYTANAMALDNLCVPIQG